MLLQGMLRYTATNMMQRIKQRTNTRESRTSRKSRQALFGRRLRQNMQKHTALYFIMIPVLLYYLIFKYIPMAGIVIAFQNYRPGLGILGSRWVGLENFKNFLTDPFAVRTIRNTVTINIYQLLFSFPAPIILALLLNELNNLRFKKTIQTISYLPHFISLVVVAGMLKDFTASDGIISDFLFFAFGKTRESMLGNSELYRTVYVASGVWQSIGWGSILYLATITNVDPQLYEASSIDGAGRWKQLIHVTMPTLVPLIVLQLILQIGSIMSEGAEKTLLLYTPLVYEVADLMSSYEYRRGLQEMSFSYGAAVGLFNSVINISFLVIANTVARKTLNESLW